MISFIIPGCIFSVPIQSVYRRVHPLPRILAIPPFYNHIVRIVSYHHSPGCGKLGSIPEEGPELYRPIIDMVNGATVGNPGYTIPMAAEEAAEIESPASLLF